MMLDQDYSVAEASRSLNVGENALVIPPIKSGDQT